MFSRDQEYNLLRFLAGGLDGGYCIYGAGKFTKELMRFVNRENLTPPSFIFDDNPSSDSIPPCDRILRTSEVDFNGVGAVIVGTDTWQNKMKAALADLKVSCPVIDLAPPQAEPDKEAKRDRIGRYFENGAVPWTEGYWDYRNDEFKKAVNSQEILGMFRRHDLGKGYGIGLDDRIVEYPWLFSLLSPEPSRLLDAGSILNFDYIVEHASLQQKKMTILTLAPEGNCFFNKAISYLYEDLRSLPLRDNSYDEIVCISTLEHIGMDNSIYGDSAGSNMSARSWLIAVQELLRVLKKGGRMYVTIPYGKFEEHGFFQQFNSDMLNEILEILDPAGSSDIVFFRYHKDGWHFASREACDDAESFNPHTGVGKKDDCAAHSRAICAIVFKKR